MPQDSVTFETNLRPPSNFGPSQGKPLGLCASPGFSSRQSHPHFRQNFEMLVQEAGMHLLSEILALPHSHPLQGGPAATGYPKVAAQDVRTPDDPPTANAWLVVGSIVAALFVVSVVIIGRQRKPVADNK